MRLKQSRSSECHEGVRCSRGVGPRTLDLDIKWRSVAILSTLNLRHCEFQSRSERFGQENKVFALSRIEPQFLDFSIHSLVTTPTKLSRFEIRESTEMIIKFESAFEMLKYFYGCYSFLNITPAMCYGFVPKRS